MDSKLIYKYLPFSINSMKLLINGEFWFGLPKNQNDPYEGEFTTKDYFSLPHNGLLEFFYKNHPELLNGKSVQHKMDEVVNDFNIFHNDLHFVLKKRLKECYGITCFSYKKDSILMWSYYADSHKGFSIIFDKNKLIETLKYPKDWVNFKDVNYRSELCAAELILEKNKIGFKNEKEILFRKLSIWRKENETRLMIIFKNSASPRNIGFNKSSVHGIIFGENMSINDKNTIRNIINIDDSYSGVQFYSTIKDLRKLKMKIIKEKIS